MAVDIIPYQDPGFDGVKRQEGRKNNGACTAVIGTERIGSVPAGSFSDGRESARPSDKTAAPMEGGTLPKSRSTTRMYCRTPGRALPWTVCIFSFPFVGNQAARHRRRNRVRSADAGSSACLAIPASRRQKRLCGRPRPVPHAPSPPTWQRSRSRM